jgi:HlyD family secretion protein
VEKLEEFDSYIVDNQVLSEYSGVVTEVPLEVSDTIGQNTILLTLYDQDEVTMDISISEDDYKTVDIDGQVNISFTAYPDTIYNGEITEVSDATYDSSSGEIYYTLTVTVLGDVSGLYEGMTGDITLVTKETKEVTYVSNRAIFRDGTRSYVKVRDADSNIVEKDVVTGFSDGVNVEIVEGLSKGDIVLIESKVSE